MIPEQNIESRLHQIIADTLERRESGEPVSDEEVLAAHPDLADRLGEKLKQLALLANARELADTHSIEATISIRPEGSEEFGSPKLSKGMRPGQRLCHYVLEEQIGVGGFGSVWRARDSKLDCEVAIKVPRRELSAEDTERFIHEARVAAQLRKHLNIVSVHEADWEAGTAFIVSDYVDGDSLDDRLDRSRVPFNEAVELIITVCQALQHAHEEGIIHRDLKPENILLDHSGVPHITDFGLAMRASEFATIVPGRITGTAAYMSPEQAGGESDRADCRSDIFSLGIVFFELLTGERPYRGSVPLILRQIRSDEPPRPRSFDPRIPADLETICLKCLEKDPTRRYQSAVELSEDLQRFHRREPIKARSVSAAGRLLRWSQRNPSIPLLSLSLMIVTIFSTWVAFSFLDKEVNELQAAYKRQAEQNLRLLAEYAADDAKLNLALRIDQVGRVLTGLANDEVAMTKLVEWNDAERINGEQRNKILGILRDSDGMAKPSELKEIQRALEELYGVAGPDIRERTYSLFLCDAEGNQIARYKRNETLGKPFAHRSYFTGDTTDAPEGAKPELKWGEDARPRLSSSFLTIDEEARVIAVSAPIWDDDGEFQGVTGVFIRLGNLISDPKNLIMNREGDEGNSTSTDDERAMWVLDARGGLKDARLIHDSSQGQAIQDIQTFDLSQLDTTFPDHRTKLQPIELPNGTKPGLVVLMKEQSETVEAPGNRLQTNLVTIGLSVVGFAALVLSVIWLIILQRVVKT